MTLLLLRGEQTPGELRGRSDRLHAFATPAEVEDALRTLAAGPEPLVAERARRPGQKETRWTHLAGGAPAGAADAAPRRRRLRRRQTASPPASRLSRRRSRRSLGISSS